MHTIERFENMLRNPFLADQEREAYVAIVEALRNKEATISSAPLPFIDGYSSSAIELQNPLKSEYS